jgi:AraC-like DNA-binding protein
MASVTIDFRSPAEPLRRYISTYNEMTVTDGPVQDLLHPEWANIRMSLDNPWIFESRLQGRVEPGAAIIHGPTSTATRVEGQGRAFGIGILPTGWNRLWRKDAAQFADQLLPLETLLAEDAAELTAHLLDAPNLDARAAIADAFLLKRLEQSVRSPFDQQVDAFFQVLSDPASASVEQITATLGLPQSRLARLAKRGFGFPPKLLLKRQRFLRMLGTLHARPYSEWGNFIDPQYADQSHMIRDFQDFLGLSPSKYFLQERPILAAAAKARAAHFGQPLQGLHHPASR